VTEAVAIILAAGAGDRMGRGAPKAFLPIGDGTMVELAMRTAAACPQVTSIVAAVPEGFEDAIAAVGGLDKSVTAVSGGASRQASVIAALAAVPASAQIVVCHDAARPFASAQLFSRVIGAVTDGGDPQSADGAIPVTPVTDTVKRVRDGVVVATEPREELFLAQTPQAFRAESFRAAHERAASEGHTATDEAAVLEWAGYRVVSVRGEPDNLKVTTSTDLARAEAIIKTGGALR